MLNIMNPTKTNKLILAAFAFVAVFALSSGRAHAATINVATGTDTVAVDSSCSLSEAIGNINDQAATNTDCIAGDGNNDTINIPAGTITLSNDLPDVTKSVIIQGQGTNSTTIDGADINCDGSAAHLNLEVKNLSITKPGDQGIFSQDCDLTAYNVQITDASGLSNPLTAIMISITKDSENYVVDISDVTIKNNLGMIAGIIIYNDQQSLSDSVGISASIANVSIANNTSHTMAPFTSSLLINNKGGIINGTIGLSNVTINNTAAKSNGFFGALGDDDNLDIKLTNNTFVGNPGSGSYGGAVTISSGGSSSQITLQNNLFIGNGADGAGTCAFIGGVVVSSLGNNLNDNSSCSLSGPNDQQNVAGLSSTIGTIQDNGGSVPTMALLPGSPAIDAGANALGVTTDARGVARPSSNPSVGAYQYVLGDQTTTPAASGTSAPNTGVSSVVQSLNILASVLGLGLLAYVFRKQQRSS